jgi:hypothetical protein
MEPDPVHGADAEISNIPVLSIFAPYLASVSYVWRNRNGCIIEKRDKIIVQNCLLHQIKKSIVVSKLLPQQICLNEDVNYQFFMERTQFVWLFNENGVITDWRELMWFRLAQFHYIVLWRYMYDFGQILKVNVRIPSKLMVLFWKV